MTVVSGDITIVTETPALITEVRVHAPATRTFGDGVITTLSAPVSYAERTGEVLFNAAPGPAVLSLKSGSRPVDSVPLLVPDDPSATLRQCVEAALLADEGTISALERLALEVTGMVATIQNITQLEEWADSAKQDATTAQEIATNLPATIQNELDTRVPPEVAEALSTDQTIRDAATLAVNDAVDSGLPGKADTTYVDQQDQALSERIDEEKWSRGAARSNDADLIRGAGMEGVWNFGTAGVNLPERLTGYVAFVEASYHKSTNSTHQRAWSTNPYRRGEQYERSYWSGSWSEWEEVGPGSDESHSPSTEWVQGLLLTTHLDTVTEGGVWRQHNNSSATVENGYPSGATQGVLQVVEISAGMVHQAYFTKDGLWVRRSFNGAFNGPWVDLSGGGGGDATPVDVDWVKGLLYTTHLDTITDDGIYRQHSSGSADVENGYPEGSGRGILQVVGITATEIHQTYSTQSGAWVRRIVSGEPTMWAKLNPTVDQYQITQNFQAGEEKVGINWAERDTRIDQMRQAVGRVNTGGKAAICLSFDHGTKNFKEFVLPALQERGLKSSLALNSQRLDPSFGHYASEGATWAEVKAWADSGVEITNHSRTHQGAIGETDTYREIVLGREELEAHIGRPVWTWRGHGYLAGNDHDYDGFGAANGTPEGFYNTYAGKLLLSSHPMVTGGIKPPYDCFPLDGEIPIGPRGAWIDTPSQMATAKANIQHAVDTGQRLYINCHPQFVEFNNEYITRQDLFDFFDYVKGFIDNGELVDLTFAEWAVADSGETVVTGGIDQAYVDHSIASLHHYSGTGFPEGKVSAPVGATYTDTAATNGALRWIKAQGTGSTGWRVSNGDTGWRNITDELTGSVLGMGTGAKVLIRRKSYDLEVLFVGPITLTASWGAVWSTSQGFRPERESETALGEDTRLRLGTYNARIENATRDSELVPSGRSLFASLPSEVRWPTTLQGTPE